MKIFVNIILLLILLALLAAAVTLPRQWTGQENRTPAAAAKRDSLLLKADEPLEASPDIPLTETEAELPAKTEEAAVAPTSPAVTPSHILEIVSKLQRGESDEAAILINEALETLEDHDAIALQSIVSKDAARTEQIELLTTQLAESREELAAVEKSSRKALDDSLNTLAIAISKAEEAAAEAKQRSRELEEAMKQKPAEMKAAQTDQPKPKAPAGLPDNDLIDFSFGSTYLNPANKETLSRVAAVLNDRSDIVVQLRGHTDTVGDPEYNANLATARCEMARDFLIEKGIELQRISVVSFGETQVFKDGVVAEKPRRVEILFRKKS